MHENFFTLSLLHFPMLYGLLFAVFLFYPKMFYFDTLSKKGDNYEIRIRKRTNKRHDEVVVFADWRRHRRAFSLAFRAEIRRGTAGRHRRRNAQRY
jgi:hypothetical protein